ncbi:hypothetical protein GCM10009849_36200 [Sinomonas flava]|uniref:Uncharacterized protein n=1 Tax=Sinomonas flava TaxID=496857 RepID=A0ABN3C2M8_9MICC
MQVLDEADEQAAAHRAFAHAASDYQNCYRRPLVVRKSHRLTAMRAAFEWEVIVSDLSSVTIAPVNGDPADIDRLRMELLQRNPPSHLKWLLARVGRTGRKYAINNISDFVHEWTTSRLATIDGLMGTGGHWRSCGPECRRARIDSNEALATLRLSIMAGHSGDELLQLLAGMLLAS